MWIDGQPTDGVDAVARENPSSPTQIVGEVATASPEHVAAAVRAAGAAFVPWAALDPQERIEAVTRAIASTTEGREGHAQILSRELGKVIADARGEVGFAEALARYCGPVAARLSTPVIVDDAESRFVSSPDPFGVVAAITPWNAPVILAALKALPALMTGNTMVVKPSPLSPITVTRYLSEVASRLPAGVLNIVNGGGEVGEALVSDPRVAKISFTGGLATATAIAGIAARRVAPTVMELGGNDAAIFLPDATFDEATMQRAVFGAFLSSGQVCMAIKRLFVPVHREQEFIEQFQAAASRVLRVGNPLSADSTMGPVITREHQQRILGLVESARHAGGTVHDVGEISFDGVDESGYWIVPSVVSGLGDDHPLVKEEQFGPTVPVLTYESIDEVVARANSVDHGLASSVWSTDEDQAFAVASRLDVGFTFINCHNRAGVSLRAPFGGRGISGHGREFGEAGVAEYLQTHSINYPVAVRSGHALGNAYPVPLDAA